MKTTTKKLKGLFLAIFMGVNIIMVGCSTNITDSKVEISFSNFTGTREKEFSLNSYDNALNMKGSVSLKSGEVSLCIKVKETGEVLYQHIIDASNTGKISIDIDDLNENRNLLFVLESQSAKDFKISLVSEQKLILDKETPEKPEKPSK